MAVKGRVISALNACAPIAFGMGMGMLIGLFAGRVEGRRNYDNGYKDGACAIMTTPIIFDAHPEVSGKVTALCGKGN
jgi:hypothetical protein